MSKTIVVKLGGSLVSPSNEKLFDFNYLKDLKKILLPLFDKGYKFFFILGGGSLMRMYRDQAREAGITKDNDLHWIGTTVNVLHAQIFRAFFSEFADEEIIKFEDYYQEGPINIEKSIKAGGGGRPGHSGDVDAVRVALKSNADYILSLKNIDYIYTADPKFFPEATPINQLNWDEYMEIIGNPSKHPPGGNFPVDPIASKMAKENKLKMIIMSGWDIQNVENFLLDKEYKGSVIVD